MELVEYGTVKFYKADKGYGFILHEGTGHDVMFHTTGLTEPVREHDRVCFSIQDTPEGLRAVAIRKVVDA